MANNKTPSSEAGEEYFPLYDHFSIKHRYLFIYLSLLSYCYVLLCLIVITDGCSKS